MTCDEARPLIEIYLDDELDALTSLGVEGHLGSCAQCAGRRDRLLLLRRAAREQLAVYRPSPLLLRRLSRSVAPPVWRRALPVGAIAAVALAASVLLVLSPDSRMSDEVASAHVRSLLASHITDVAASDQHVVKPWFQGKVDFAVPAHDFTADGFPLVGGRLDYVGGRPVAALVYRHGAHYINLFLWPSSALTGRQRSTHNGYNQLHWTQDALAMWLVSDVQEPDLERLADLVTQASR